MIKLMTILQEEPYVDVSKTNIGKTTTDSGITTKLTDIDPSTGKMGWDVSYDVDPKEVYEKLSDLYKFLANINPDSPLIVIRDQVKKLRNKTSRLIVK
jgi:hypothetical protein